ncbi:hypothetical protein B0H14DRAFT_3125860 [Mycena olivaceomarginata]|nr:hypothetical protein B0H14DRAFT_3125860 [Mycena olivaceomarginata]
MTSRHADSSAISSGSSSTPASNPSRASSRMPSWAATLQAVTLRRVTLSQISSATSSAAAIRVSRALSGATLASYLASDSDEPPSTLIPAPAPESTLPVGARAFDEAPSTSVSAAASVSIGAPSTDEAPSDSDDSDVSADGEVSDDSGLADGVPADSGIEARGFLGSLLSKLIGAGEQSIESLLKGALLGGQVQRRGFFTLEGETLAEKGIGAILSKLFGKQTSALADLDDDEVITLLRHVASKNSQSEHAFSDLSDDEVITLLKYVASKSPKREKSLNDLD